MQLNPEQQEEIFGTSELTEFPRDLAEPPKVTTLAQVKEELPLSILPAQQGSSDAKVDPVDESTADRWFNELIAVTKKDSDIALASVDAIGEKESGKMVQMNQMLEEPLQRLGESGTDGGPIAKDLAKLKVTLESVDPNQIKFDRGLLGFIISLFSWFPGVGTPLKIYFTKFRASGAVIQDIFKSLTEGKKMLLRDMEVLKAERRSMRELSIRVSKVITVGHLVAKKLQAHIDNEPDEETQRFLKEELQFRLLQRMGDLQQQVNAHQKGVIMYKVLCDNNDELIRGVKRCWTVTLPILRIGVTAAMALTNQKIVLEGVKSLNDITEKMDSFATNLLTTQGVEIQKIASTTLLKDSVLSGNMKRVLGALDDLSTFRVAALAEMKAAIADRQKSIDEAEQAIVRMEKGEKARTNFLTLEVPMAAAA